MTQWRSQTAYILLSWFWLPCLVCPHFKMKLKNDLWLASSPICSTWGGITAKPSWKSLGLTPFKSMRTSHSFLSGIPSDCWWLQACNLCQICNAVSTLWPKNRDTLCTNLLLYVALWKCSRGLMTIGCISLSLQNCDVALLESFHYKWWSK